MMTSVFNLVAITIERYFKVVYPIMHRVSFTNRTALISVMVVWLLGPTYQLALNLPTSAIIDGQCYMQSLWPSLKVKYFQNVIYFILQYLGPLFVFSFCYTRMALVLQRGSMKTPPVAPGSEATGNTKTVSASSKRALNNIVKTMILVSIAFFVCFSPNQWLFFCFNFGLFDYGIFSHPIYNISVIALYMNCCINPAIYVASYQQFREAVKRMLCPKASSKVSTTGTVQPSTATAATMEQGK